MLGTFLPPPHCDGVFRLHPHRQQQLPCSAEVNVADAFSMRTSQDGQCLLGHGVPHVDGRGEACEERPNRRNHTTSQPQNRGRKYQDLNIQGPVDHRTETPNNMWDLQLSSSAFFKEQEKKGTSDLQHRQTKEQI